MTAEPCLADFDGIFAVVSGHPTIESGSELAAYEAGKLESIQEVASSHAEYAPYMAALQSRLGCGALWEHIVEQDLDQHSLRWLKDEQVTYAPHVMMLHLWIIHALSGSVTDRLPC